MLLLVRTPFRLLVGPIVVASLAAAQLWGWGIGTVLIGAYLAFLLAVAAVCAWRRFQLRLARRRIVMLRRNRR